VYSVARRDEVRAWLLERAATDPAIVGAAVTGSAARDAQDRWSDVDLFFGVAPGVAVPDVVRAWSDAVHGELGGVHHFDVRSGPAVYRAFLLRDLLELDLGFAPAESFGPREAGAFRVVFGDPVAPAAAGAVDVGSLVGYTWHHVRHARACIDRGRGWQAEHWISGVRDNVLTLAAARLGAPTDYAKGAHQLPDDVTGPLADALVRSLDAAELGRALAVATRAFLRELRIGDPATAEALEGPLAELTAAGGGRLG
jgi:hypothetical protein